MPLLLLEWEWVKSESKSFTFVYVVSVVLVPLSHPDTLTLPHLLHPPHSPILSSLLSFAFHLPMVRAEDVECHVMLDCLWSLLWWPYKQTPHLCIQSGKVFIHIRWNIYIYSSYINAYISMNIYNCYVIRGTGSVCMCVCVCIQCLLCYSQWITVINPSVTSCIHK